MAGCVRQLLYKTVAATPCTDAPNPAGENGRPWCYVEAQLLGGDASSSSWNYCAPVVDYDQLRKEAGEMSKAKAEQVQGLVAKLQKTQRAAEDALDKYAKACGA